MNDGLLYFTHPKIFKNILIDAQFALKKNFNVWITYGKLYGKCVACVTHVYIQHCLCGPQVKILYWLLSLINPFENLP